MLKKISLLLTLGLFCLVGAAHAEFNDEMAQDFGGMPNPADARPLQQYRYLNSFQKRFEESDEKENIKRYEFSTDRIIKISLRENMLTNLILPKGEGVLSFDLRDKTNFRFFPKPAPLDNIAIIYGINPGSDTNLTVYGDSGNIYSFYLRNYSTKVKSVAPDFLIYVIDQAVTDAAFIKKQEIEIAEKAVATENGECIECLQANVPKGQKEDFDPDYLRSLPVKVDPSKLNMSYVTSKGDMDLQPLKIWDDEYWTYFQFDVDNFDKLSGVPVVYLVNSNGEEEPVNNRVNKGTVIAETVNPKWTLRRGDSYLCVREENAKDRK